MYPYDQICTTRHFWELAPTAVVSTPAIRRCGVVADGDTLLSFCSQLIENKDVTCIQQQTGEKSSRENKPIFRFYCFPFIPILHPVDTYNAQPIINQPIILQINRPSRAQRIIKIMGSPIQIRVETPLLIITIERAIMIGKEAVLLLSMLRPRYCYRGGPTQLMARSIRSDHQYQRDLMSGQKSQMTILPSQMKYTLSTSY